MHYQNDTFLFLLQEVSLKYHKSSIKYHKSNIKYHKNSMKYHKNSLLTIFHDIAQKPSQTLGTQCPQLRATDAQHMGYRCPSRGP